MPDILVVSGKPLCQLVGIHRPVIMQPPQEFNPFRSQQSIYSVNALEEDPVDGFLFFRFLTDPAQVGAFFRQEISLAPNLDDKILGVRLRPLLLNVTEGVYDYRFGFHRSPGLVLHRRLENEPFLHPDRLYQVDLQRQPFFGSSPTASKSASPGHPNLTNTPDISTGPTFTCHSLSTLFVIFATPPRGRTAR